VDRILGTVEVPLGLYRYGALSYPSGHESGTQIHVTPNMSSEQPSASRSAPTDAPPVTTTGTGRTAPLAVRQWTEPDPDWSPSPDGDVWGHRRSGEPCAG
jgi:hypothetical protein